MSTTTTEHRTASETTLTAAYAASRQALERAAVAFNAATARYEDSWGRWTDAAAVLGSPLPAAMVADQEKLEALAEARERAHKASSQAWWALMHHSPMAARDAAAAYGPTGR